MKFAFTVTILAAVLASAIAAPKPDFFADMAANAQKMQAAIKDWTQQWANNVQEKQVEFTKAQDNFGNIGQKLKSALHSKWQEFATKGQAFAQQASAALEKTKAKIQAGIEAKRTDAITLAKKLSEQGKEFLGQAEKVKQQMEEKIVESVKNLETQAKQFATQFSEGWANGETSVNTFITDAGAKMEKVRQEATEKVKEAEAYAQTLKDAADKVLTQQFGTSNYNEVITKLSQVAQDTLTNYSAKMNEAVEEGTKKAESMLSELSAGEDSLFAQAKSAWEQMFKAQVSQ